MSKKEIEKAIGDQLVPFRDGNIYQGRLKFDGKFTLGKFIFGNTGLEAMTIETQMTEDTLIKEFEIFQGLYGAPSGSDGSTVQWLAVMIPR